MTRSIRLSVFGIVVVALLAFAPGAFASTLSKSGNTVTWTADPGFDNQANFDTVDPDTVVIYLNQDPVTYPAGTDDVTPGGECTDTDGTNTDGMAYTITCTGMTGGTVVADSGDGADNLDGYDLTEHHLTAYGGSGNDNITGGSLDDNLNGQDGDDYIQGRPGNDTIDAGPGNDNDNGDETIVGGPGNDSIVLGDGDDGALGGPGNDTINGGAGDDEIQGDCGGVNNCGAGTDGNDTINGEDGRDDLRGNAGDDAIDGGAGDDDRIGGGPGNDTLNGGDGNDDDISGGPGSDNLNGGNGDDRMEERTDHGCCNNLPDDGNDVIHGGPGFDHLSYYGGGSTNDSASMTLDDQANDGYSDLTNCCSTNDPNNNFGSDLESVYMSMGDTPTNAVGSASANMIDICCGGADSVTPGAGSDIVWTNDGPDNVSADDGEADFIDCGDGIDKATVDQFDTTARCEEVTVVQRRSAFDVPEDAAPSINWVTPARGSGLSSKAANRFEAAASDDKGVQKVVFTVGLREVCTDTTAPYTCDYQVSGLDVGLRKVLTATAYDTAGQTATAFNQVNIPRLAPRSVTSRTRPAKDSSAPWKFTTTGKVNRPGSVTAAQGCKGNVSVQIRAGKKTISNRRVGVKKNCTFRSSVTFAIKSRLKPQKLQVLVRFLGNEVMTARSAKRRAVRAA